MIEADTVDNGKMITKKRKESDLKGRLSNPVIVHDQIHLYSDFDRPGNIICPNHRYKVHMQRTGGGSYAHPHADAVSE